MSVIETRDENGKPQVPKSDAANAYDLLSDVIACIENEPRRLDMGHWLLHGSRLDRFLDASGLDPENDAPACGTAGCVAGWIVLLTTPNRRIDFHEETVAVDAEIAGRVREIQLPVADRAAQVLGIDDSTNLTMRGLFNGDVEIKNPDADPDDDDDDSYTTLEYGDERYVPAVIDRIKTFQRAHQDTLKATVIEPRGATAL